MIVVDLVPCRAFIFSLACANSGYKEVFALSKSFLYHLIEIFNLNWIDLFQIQVICHHTIITQQLQNHISSFTNFQLL